VQAGLAPDVAAMAGLLSVDFATNAIIEEGRDQAMRAAFGSGSTVRHPEISASGSRACRPSSYPTLVSLASDLTDTDAQARFRFGINVLITGLRA